VAEWELEYSFLEYYSLPDISPASLDTLLEEIRHVHLVVKLKGRFSREGL
jgi:hypothetical protein